LRFRARHVQIQRDDAAALTQFMNFLRCHGVVPREKVPPRRLIPTEQVVHTFQRLRKERMLAEATVIYYVTFAQVPCRSVRP
jgi:RIO-like serine/threonine protein kinase